MTGNAARQFEVFRRQTDGRQANEPWVTIQHRGVISFNKAAHVALGKPDAVELLYDQAERIVSLATCDPAVDHAYPVRSQGSTSLISGQAFTRHYGLSVEVSKRWPAYMEDGVLCVDLKQEGVAVTRAPRQRREDR